MVSTNVTNRRQQARCVIELPVQLPVQIRYVDYSSRQINYGVFQQLVHHARARPAGRPVPCMPALAVCCSSETLYVTAEIMI